MKSSFIAFVSLFLFLIGAVVATPTTLDSTEIVKGQNFQALDVILTDFKTSIDQTNARYNAITTVKQSDVKAYCDEIGGHIRTCINKCRQIPPGHKFPDILFIAKLLCDILRLINDVLELLLSKCGLLGGPISPILLLVIGLIVALNELIVVVAGVCSAGLLLVLIGLVMNLLGANCLLIICGLKIVA